MVDSDNSTFFARWKKGITDLTPLQQLRAKRLGTFGQLAGMLLAIGVLSYQGLWYWIPFLAFSFFIIIIDVLGLQSQIKQLEKVIG